MPTRKTTETTNETALTTEQVQEVVKKKRGAKWVQDLTAAGGDNVEPGENSRFVRHALVSWNLPPIDISDPKQVEQRIGDYFQYCVDNDRRPQIVGMCNWIGITRETLNQWENGGARGATHTDMIKKARCIIEEMWADMMMTGKINPASGIFLSKNWFNYKDVSDVVVTPNNPLQDMDPEQAKRRLLDAVPDEDE